MKKTSLKILGLERNPYNDNLFGALQSGNFNVTVFYTVANTATKNNTSWGELAKPNFEYKYISKYTFWKLLNILFKSREETFIFTGYASFSFLISMALCVLFKINFLVFTDVPVVDSKRGFLRGVARGFARWLAFFKSDGVLTTGTPGRNALIRLGCDETKIVNYPYTPSLYDMSEVAPNELSQLPIMSECPVILFSGQLIYRKGVDVLLYALHILKRRGVEFQAIVEGDGPMMGFLRELCIQLEIHDDVHFTGFNNSKIHAVFMHRANIVVSPSRWEPWGNIVPEAMSAGKVVIASSSVASAADRITNDVNGLIFQTDNPAQLVSHLSRAILDAGFSERLSTEAKNSAEIWTADMNAIFLASYLNAKFI